MSTDPITLTTITPDLLPAAYAGIVSVYRAAFGAPPYHRDEADVQDFAESLTAHAARPGFRCLVAHHNSESRIVGFTYGYTVAPGQWWYEQVAPLLPAPFAPQTLVGAFLLTQLAVLPTHQGHGLGGRLHDALLADLPHPRALLSTRQEETPARRLYHRRGWTTLLTDVPFPGANAPYLVLTLPFPTPFAP